MLDKFRRCKFDLLSLRRHRHRLLNILIDKPSWVMVAGHLQVQNNVMQKVFARAKSPLACTPTRNGAYGYDKLLFTKLSSAVNTRIPLMPFWASHSTFYHIQDEVNLLAPPPVSDRAIKLIKISGYRVTSTHRWDAKVPCVFFPYFIIAKYMDNLKALLLLMYVCMCPLRLLLLLGMRNAKLIWRQTLKEHNLRDWIWI